MQEFVGHQPLQIRVVITLISLPKMTTALSMGASTKVYQICVLNKVTVSPHFAVYCGTPIQLKATGGSNFSWTPPAGLSATNTYSPLAAPLVDTKYTFSSDCGSDTALILSRPPFTMDAGIGGSICRNGQIQLNASVDNTLFAIQN
jgi:hypothetical protein